jgi:excisionase family DNA binding protein
LAEVADITRTPAKTIYSWIHDGRLASYKPGVRRLIREDDLLAYIEGRPQPSREQAA